MKTLSLLVYSALFGLFISCGVAIVQDEDSREIGVSEDLEKLNITRTNDSIIERRLSRAVPGIDGRIINPEPPSIVTTEPPLQTPAPATPAPSPEEKGVCGPTALAFIALAPLIYKRKYNF